MHNTVLPESHTPPDGKVRFAAASTEVRATATEVIAVQTPKRDKASISSDKGGLVEAGGIFSAQEYAATVLLSFKVIR